MIKIKEIPISGYQKVIEARDEETKLHCFIAIHDCTLGPALGGTRMYPYRTPDEALNDALRLAKSMTYKSALAEDGLGGGKSVIIADPAKEKTEMLLRSFGEVVNQLKGLYIAAEDVGTSPEDMLIIRQCTPYVVALPTDRSSGDPSRYTARGVFRGIQAIGQKLWKSSNLKNRRIAIQGLGHVGSKLAEILYWEGAHLIVSDIDEDLVRHYVHIYGAKAVEPKDIFSAECDIFSPCALGGILNEATIPLLRCKAIAGSANNQLADERQGNALFERGILYAPDYIINSGGILNASTEFDPKGYDPQVARDKVDRIYDRLLVLIEKAEKENKPPELIAVQIAEYNLKHHIGKRAIPIIFDKR